MKLRYTEAFYSVQGEGRFTGVPSVFLRMYGCNFTCPGFGLPHGQETTEPDDIAAQVKENPDRYKKLDDLPLATTGCDSYAAWHPAFKRFQTTTDVDGLVDYLLTLVPNGRWTQENGQDVHLVITGGEPLLGWQRMYTELFDHPRMKDLKNVTFETNTTQSLHDDFKSYLENAQRLHVTWSCSPKLSVSGHTWDDAIKPDIARAYSDVPGSQLYFKFVVCDLNDVAEVDRAVSVYGSQGVHAPVYLMAVGGTTDSYFKNGKAVAELALEKGYRYSPRLHVDVFGNAWGT